MNPGRAIVVAIVFTVVLQVVPPPGAAPSVRAAEGCTHTIAPDVDTVDGSENFSDVGPGSVLCIAGGTRGNLKLFNLRGTAERPVVVRNADGQVRITGEQFADGAIIIAGSSFLRLTGSGVESRCGAEFDSDEQACGIVIERAKKGIKLKTNKNELHDIEIDHVAVTDLSQEMKTRGIAIHPLPGLLVGGIHIHHNYVSNSLAEGIYVGSEPHGRPLEELAKVERVRVHHNLVENTGYDGIKIKVAIRDVAVHDNVVRNAGLTRTPAHEGGIKIAMSVGDYFNNTVIGAVEGIRMGRTIESPGTRYFNNLVVNVLEVGIEASEDGAWVFNNTVVNSAKVGIRATGQGAVVVDNIVADAKNPIKVTRGRAARNVVGKVSEIGFANPSAAQFWLSPGSPAVDTGKQCGTVPAFDRRWAVRPWGARIDVGAFELGAVGTVSSPPGVKQASELFVRHCHLDDLMIRRLYHSVSRL